MCIHWQYYTTPTSRVKITSNQLLCTCVCVFFFYRFRDKDFLYEDDWAKLCEAGDLSLQTAFSRQNPDGTGARVYVQRRIREHAGLLARLIVDRGAGVLVSGSAKQMPRDVREAFRDALAGHEKVRPLVCSVLPLLFSSFKNILLRGAIVNRTKYC